MISAGTKGDQRTGKDDVPAGGILTDKGVNGNRNGLGLIGGQCQIRHQEVVPDAQTVQHDQRGGAGSQQGEHHAPECLELGAAVDLGGLLNVDGNALQKAGVQQRASNRSRRCSR